MKLKFCLMGMLCLFFQGYAQSQTTNKALTIGDKVPDVEMSTIVNSNFKSAKLSDFKGKIVILDFWATHCGSCVKLMPKVDSLQRVYGKQVQFLIINPANWHETDRDVRNILNLTNELMGRKFKVPIVRNDISFMNLFEVTTIPHIVWIDGDGKVAAITKEKYVTGDNIDKLLKGGVLDLPVKSRKF